MKRKIWQPRSQEVLDALTEICEERTDEVDGVVEFSQNAVINLLILEEYGRLELRKGKNDVNKVKRYANKQISAN